MTANPISAEAQGLIDARLDTIDRMLLGRTTRADRLDIVREVESQIFEQLQQRGAGEPGRDDVLAVLSRLDPPEAYLPDDDGRPAARSATPVGRPVASPLDRNPGRSTTGRVSGLAGLVGACALSGIIVSGLGAHLLGSIWPIYLGSGGSALVALVAGSIGVVLGLYERCRHPWSIVGVVAGAAAILGSVATIPFLFMLFSNS